MKHEAIENDILDSVELTDITQEELDNMSNEDLKAFQRGKSDDELNVINKKIEFSHVSAVFFIICGILLYVNPILNTYLFIIPSVLTAFFIARALVLGVHLKTAEISRKMLELFFEEF